MSTGIKYKKVIAKFLDGNREVDAICNYNEFAKYLNECEDNVFYYPFEWLGDYIYTENLGDIAKYVWEEIDSKNDFEKYCYPEYANYRPIETIVYANDLFDCGEPIEPLDEDLLGQGIAFYRTKAGQEILNGDNSEIVLIDLENSNIALFDKLIKHYIYVKLKNGKVYVLFSGCMI